MKTSLPSYLLALLFSLALIFQASGQQRVDHHLVVELDDVRNVVTGTDSLFYHNSSTDTLRHLYFHLWPNALQPGTSLEAWMTDHGDGRLYYSGGSERGAVTGLFFRVEQHRLRWEYHEGRSDICRVELREPLLPGEVLNLHTMFRLQVPGLVTGELSHSGQAYFLANWFPRPAVYGTAGWQLTPNHHQGRLPGEFGSFTVTITLPRNYVVASSGLLSDDPDEEKFLQGLIDRARRVNRWGSRESARFPASASRNKTISFHRDNASDFVLCLDKRFNILSDTVMIGTGDMAQVITINLFFTVFEADEWSRAMPVVKRAVRYMSEQTGAYPYETLSLVQTSWLPEARAYPGLIRLGAAVSPLLLETAIAYGVADHWFNVHVVTDHYRDPWLSRGLPGYFTLRYLREAYPDTITMQDILFDPGMRMNISGLRSVPVNRVVHYRMAMVPEGLAGSMMRTAEALSPDEYTGLATLKSAYAFSTLAGWMGEEAFAAMLKRYYALYGGRHAGSEALTEMIRREAGEEVFGWFASELLLHPAMPDYRLSAVKRVPDGYRLSVRNMSGVATPFPLTIKTRHGETTRWYPGHTGKAHLVVPDTAHTARRFTIDSHYATPELNRRDNTIRAKGLFPKAKPLAVAPLIAIPDPMKTQIILAPVLGWNANNGFMAGLATYSNPVITPATEYLIMPLYGFGNGKPAGTAKIVHHKRFITGAIERVSVGIEAKQYGYDSRNIPLSYNRVMPWGELQLRSPSHHVTSLLRVRTAIIDTETRRWDASSESWQQGSGYLYMMNELMYRYRVQRLLNPFTLQALVQHSDEMLRLMTETRFLISYPSPGKGLSVRVFGGIMVMKL